MLDMYGIIRNIVASNNLLLFFNIRKLFLVDSRKISPSELSAEPGGA